MGSLLGLVDGKALIYSTCLSLEMTIGVASQL